MGAVKQFYHDELCAMQDDYGYEPTERDFAGMLAHDARQDATRLADMAERDPEAVKPEAEEIRATIEILQATLTKVNHEPL